MSASAENPVPPDSGAEQELCRGCLAPNESGAPFCRQCGAPLSSYASTAPFEALFAEGHVYRSAVERPHKPVIVLGIWLIFGTGFFGGSLIAVLGFTGGGLAMAPLGLFLAVVSVVILYRTTRNFLAQRKRAETAADSSPLQEG